MTSKYFFFQIIVFLTLLKLIIANENENQQDLEVITTTNRGARTCRRCIGKLQSTGLIKQLKTLRINRRWENEKEFRKGIRFKYYRDGEKVYESASDDPEALSKSGCAPDDKFAFILHGWRQSCETEWVLTLIERLTYHRGGCIVCIDYEIFAKDSYMWLYRSFRRISNIITRRILLLINEGFSPDNGYMFGFSFGGQLASAIGRSLSQKYLFRSIDTCDMAGPGFDVFINIDHRQAARHVQCLHSSRDKGTQVYTCHQNVRLGSCGHFQPAAASQPYYSSHGLCVQIYINAFDYPFYAMQYEPSWCASRRAATNIPYKYTIGYNETPDSSIRGEIFVPTSLHFPYNFSEKEMLMLGFFDENAEI
uniref:Lipase domain-containing protein n=1 Tax=Ceratitis capitata TaxID=7213 RepID=W8ANH8_CERCA